MGKSTIIITLKDSSIAGPLKEMSVSLDFDERTPMTARSKLVFSKLLEVGTDWKRIASGKSKYMRNYLEA